jgi:ribosomal protein L29
MTARAVALDNLRALSGEELAAHLREQRGQLFQVRLQQTIGQVENHRQIRAIRMEIARTMTVQVEIRIAAERGEAPPAPSPRPSVSRRTRESAEPAKAASRGRRARRAAEVAGPAPASPVEEPISDVAVEPIPAEAETATDTVAESVENDITGVDDADEDTP